jgi:hypothetical protein
MRVVRSEISDSDLTDVSALRTSCLGSIHSQ